MITNDSLSLFRGIVSKLYFRWTAVIKMHFKCAEMLAIVVHENMKLGHKLQNLNYQARTINAICAKGEPAGLPM